MSNSFQDNFDIEALRTPEGDGEAQKRFEIYKSRDPFPEIVPALLNSADIYDYVRVTGMICPFDPSKLKSASYAVPILGDYIYWNGEEEDKWQWKKLEKNQDFILEPNSIAFVSIEPKFRIPDYIALRFNLKITHIHRGILLGTGPLVDPGYVGKLLIPLHNLTTNKYKFTGGEDLIWMEFTKLSINNRWNNVNTSFKKFIHTGTLIQYNSISKIPRRGTYEEFPKTKSYDDVKQFLTKASEGRPIPSSLPGIILDSKQSATDAARKAEDADKKVESIRNFIAWGAIITGLITLFAIIIPIYSLTLDSINYVKTAPINKEEIENRIEKSAKIKKLEEDIQSLKEEIKQLKKSIE